MSIVATDKPNYTYGIKLPIPRIERVEVYSTYFNIELGIYLDPMQLDYVGDNERFKNYLTFLEENLKIYCMFVRDFKTAEDEAVWSVYDSNYYTAGGYTNRISRILNKDKTIWNYMDGDEYKNFSLGWDYPACYDDAVLAGRDFLSLMPFVGAGVEGSWSDSADSNVIKLDIGDFSFVDEIESNSRIIVKYAKRVEDILSTGTPLPLPYILNSDTYGTDISVTLFCWTSLADLTMEDYVSEDLSSIFASDDGRAKIYDLQNSSITHQHIIQNGQIKNSPDEIWTTVGSGPFYGVPHQNITQQYHADYVMSHSEVVQKFQDLLSQIPDETIPDIKQQVSYLLAIYGDTPELIPQLDTYRKSLTEKSNTTEAGKFYTVFRNRILEINRIINSDLLLRTQLIDNPVVVDYTTNYMTDSSTGVGDLGEYDGDPVDFVFYETVFMNRQAITDSWEEEGEYDWSYYPIDSLGYFFFDYEKALRASLIARIVNVNIMESLLGKAFINYYYLFNTVSVQHNRFNDYATWDAHWDDEESYLDVDDGENGVNIADIVTYFEQCPEDMWAHDSGDWWTEAGEEIYPSTYYPKIEHTETIVHDEDSFIDGSETYLRLRSFNVLNSTYGTENYRLACFEFYEYLRGFTSTKTSNDPNFDYYRFGVRMRDNTHMIFFHLRKFYKDAMGQLEIYLDAASEACGVDDEGNFNDFFADAVTAEYSSNISDAPWLKAPIVYWLHKDLWNKGAYFAGNLELLSQQAEVDAGLINPRTGTISDLQSFYELMSDYWDEVYLYGNSDIFDLMISLPSEESMNPLFGVEEEFGTTGQVFFPVPWVPESYEGSSTTAIDPPTGGGREGFVPPIDGPAGPWGAPGFDDDPGSSGGKDDYGVLSGVPGDKELGDETK